MFANLFAPLARDGYGVLAVSLRSHGDSTGGPHDAGYSARRDVIAAVDFLERDHAGGRIVLCGSSFGAAAAAYASDELGPRVHGYVFDSLYSDLPTTLWNRLDHYLPLGLDYVAYGAFRLWAPVFVPTKVDLLRPADHVARIHEDIPVVMAVGSEDFRATPAESRRMYESVKSHGKYEEFQGAGHSLLNVNDPGRYVRIVEAVLKPRTSETSRQ
jgi:pimeloyl-ACP methyl ester carboxylesterase